VRRGFGFTRYFRFVSFEDDVTVVSVEAGVLTEVEVVVVVSNAVEVVLEESGTNVADVSLRKAFSFGVLPQPLPARSAAAQTNAINVFMVVLFSRQPSDRT
jgi:hypothetical protein